MADSVVNITPPLRDRGATVGVRGKPLNRTACALTLALSPGKQEEGRKYAQG